MNTTPHKALILYSHTPLSQEVELPYVREAVSRGCCGFLKLEKEPSSTSTNDAIASRSRSIKQLLGMSTAANDAANTFSSRFGAMKIGLVSTDQAIIDNCKQYGAAYTLLLENQVNLESLTTLIMDILNDKASVTLDCLLVDLSQPKIEASWQQIDSILKTCLDTTPNTLKCVVTHAIIEGTEDTAENDRWKMIRPPQSYQFKEGVSVETIESEVLLCSYYHKGSTRRDDTTSITLEQVSRKGCNGTMLAWHFLAEIGQKLGYIPKYGA